MLDWMDSAACKGMDTQLFFEDYINHPTSIDNVCMGCPVIKQCYLDGINNHGYGVWGGFYLQEGYILKSHNSHKSQQTWNNLFTLLTTDGAV